MIGHEGVVVKVGVNKSGLRVAVVKHALFFNIITHNLSFLGPFSQSISNFTFRRYYTLMLSICYYNEKNRHLFYYAHPLAFIFHMLIGLGKDKTLLILGSLGQRSRSHGSLLLKK